MREPIRMFAAYGIELEYMIVDRQSLKVQPICDEVIQSLAGEFVNEISLGRVNVSNELVLHVIEFKGNGPQTDLVRLRESLQLEVVKMDELLKRWDARLLPTAMHPLMNPSLETKLWPHGQNTIYQTYDRIFNCKGHGWSNLQSVHINLPFANDDEFARLHAAIRLALPLLPALAASSPVVEGRLTGKLDNRLSFYAQNQKKVPSIIGNIIPEAVFSKDAYNKEILHKIEADIKPMDPEGELEGEWLNSRGAIARFERNAIEIRVLDIQESVPADFAVISLVISLVHSLADEKWISHSEQRKIHEIELKQVFMGAVEQGGDFLLEHPALLHCFGQRESLSLTDLWQKIATRLIEEKYMAYDFRNDITSLLQRGSLSSYLVKKLGAEPSESLVRSTWGDLADCLVAGRIYG